MKLISCFRFDQRFGAEAGATKTTASCSQPELEPQKYGVLRTSGFDGCKLSNNKILRGFSNGFLNVADNFSVIKYSKCILSISFLIRNISKKFNFPQIYCMVLPKSIPIIFHIAVNKKKIKHFLESFPSLLIPRRK